MGATTTKGMEVDEEKDDEKQMEVDSDDDIDEETVAKPNPTRDMLEKVEIILQETNNRSKLPGGIEKLLYLEKKQRQAENEQNTMYIANAILDLCYAHRDWQVTVEQIAILSRRRS